MNKSRTNYSHGEFLAKCVTELHNMAKRLNLLDDDIEAVPELFNDGETIVKMLRGTKILRETYNSNPVDWNYCIMVNCIASGTIIAKRWRSNEYAGGIDESAEIVASTLNGEAMPYFDSIKLSDDYRREKFFKTAWQTLVLLYGNDWNYHDEDGCAEQCQFAAYLLGVSMMLANYGYTKNTINYPGRKHGALRISMPTANVSSVYKSLQKENCKVKEHEQWMRYQVIIGTDDNDVIGDVEIDAVSIHYDKVGLDVVIRFDTVIGIAYGKLSIDDCFYIKLKYRDSYNNMIRDVQINITHGLVNLNGKDTVFDSDVEMLGLNNRIKRVGLCTASQIFGDIMSRITRATLIRLAKDYIRSFGLGYKVKSGEMTIYNDRVEVVRSFSTSKSCAFKDLDLQKENGTLYVVANGTVKRFPMSEYNHYVLACVLRLAKAYKVDRISDLPNCVRNWNGVYWN